MKKVFKYQLYHLLGFLLIGSVLIFTAVYFQSSNSVFWGLPAFSWVIFSWIFAGLHQLWIVFFWRMELYYKKISSILGRAGFTIYRIGFVVFGSLRLLAIIPVAIATAHTMAVPFYLTIPLIVIPLPLIIWAVYSVFAYFCINRAFGADHFDPSYRSGTSSVCLAALLLYRKTRHAGDLRETEIVLTFSALQIPRPIYVIQIRSNIVLKCNSDPQKTLRNGIKTIDSMGDTGRYTAIAVSGDNVYISYFDYTNGDLKFARSTDSGASFSYIDNVPDYGLWMIQPFWASILQLRRAAIMCT